MIVETVCRMGHVLLLGCRLAECPSRAIAGVVTQQSIRANVTNVGILGGWTAGDCTRSKPRELDEIDPMAKRRL